MNIDLSTHPYLCAAFRLIEEDNGGHLIGTVYPGEEKNLDKFYVPDSATDYALKAEAALKVLKETHPDLWSEFIVGEETAANFIEHRFTDLDKARELLNDYFDGWPVEGA